MNGEAVWAPPNDNCKTYFILISIFRKKSCSIKVSETFLHSTRASSQEVQKKKKKKNLRVSGGSVPLNPTRQASGPHK